MENFTAITVLLNLTKNAPAGICADIKIPLTFTFETIPFFDGAIGVMITNAENPQPFCIDLRDDNTFDPNKPEEWIDAWIKKRYNGAGDTYKCESYEITKWKVKK